jgi:DNA topoisomerase-1
LPGQELFAYIDDEGQPRKIGSADVNDYLRRVSGEDFTAKGFRTWAATALAIWTLGKLEPCNSIAAGRCQVNKAVSLIANRLGNTRTVCRKSYIHPDVIAAYLTGSLKPMLQKHLRRARKKGERHGVNEIAVIGVLRELSAVQRQTHGTGIAPATCASRRRSRR